MRIPATPGKTRARLLIPEELAVIFEFAAKHTFLALHNHPLSGMSLPLHDHWHFHPLHRLFRKYFRHILGGEANRFPISFRAKGTLAEIAVIGGAPSLAALAAKTASIFNRLEAQNIVTTLLFNPSRGGQVLICVLDPAVPQELKSRLGCLPMLNRLRETELVGGLRAPARPGTVNWHELTGGLVTLRRSKP